MLTPGSVGQCSGSSTAPLHPIPTHLPETNGSCKRGWGRACPALAFEWLWKPSGWLSPKESWGRSAKRGRKQVNPQGGQGAWEGGTDQRHVGPLAVRSVQGAAKGSSCEEL